MTAGNNAEIAGEHALREGEKDRLGFVEVANRIANSIVDRASKDGLVIGLDGEWGSGKSSLLHLIERSLGQLPADKRPTVINFRPWLIGDRDALLTTLFSDLADKIADVHLSRGNATNETILKAKKAAEAVRNFGKALTRAGELLEAIDGVAPTAGWWGKIVGGVGKSLDKEPKAPDLAALKDKITKDLKELDSRFIITVDDVDRLEPKEVIEVLRLVRSVADFPTIIYLLCYDAERVAEAITTGAKVANGAAYLEKIVQLTVLLPKPEPFELRQWFEEDLRTIIGVVPDRVQARLKTVIDQEGGQQLRTPRAVVRTLDSVRFFWPALRDEKIDVADLVWIQLLKDGSPKFYRWVEAYVASSAAISFGTATVSDNAKAERLKALAEACAGDKFGDPMYRFMLEDLLPGVQSSHDQKSEPLKIYQPVNQTTRQRAVDGHRLASPDHYRLYFSLIGPAHAIAQSGFDEFWAAVDAGPDQTAQFLLDLNQEIALGSLRKTDVLFERLRGLEAQLWTSRRARNLLFGLSQMMDDAYRSNPSEESFVVDTWDRAFRLVPILYAHLADDERATVNKQFFGDGRALGWLTSILRRETFAHGKYGEREKRREEWWLSEDDFEAACCIMIDRYRSIDLKTMMNTPRPLDLIFAWRQAGDEDGPGKFLAEVTATDEGLVDALGMFVTAIDSSDRGRYFAIKSENVSHFFNYDSIIERLTEIVESGSPELREKASELIGMARLELD